MAGTPGEKLGFIARLSLVELQHAHPVDWLPRSGALLFFYDLKEQPWGFDPKDRGSATVLLVPDLPAPVSTPAWQDTSEFILPHRNIECRRIEVMLPWEREPLKALKLNAKEDDQYFELSDLPFQGQPKHQVAGFPCPIQGDDMELQCQLVTHGIYCGNPSGYTDPRVETLALGAANWRLLFQVDTDDDLGIMWGDCGSIYFWVEEQAARKGDFQNTWLVLQCG